MFSMLLMAFLPWLLLGIIIEKSDGEAILICNWYASFPFGKFLGHFVIFYSLNFFYNPSGCVFFFTNWELGEPFHFWTFFLQYIFAHFFLPISSLIYTAEFYLVFIWKLMLFLFFSYFLYHILISLGFVQLFSFNLSIDFSPTLPMIYLIYENTSDFIIPQRYLILIS